LVLLSPDDQRVIRLAVLAEVDGEALAAALGITAGAARVRLHRAIKRLRARYQAANDDSPAGTGTKGADDVWR